MLARKAQEKYEYVKLRGVSISILIDIRHEWEVTMTLHLLRARFGLIRISLTKVVLAKWVVGLKGRGRDSPLS